MERVREIGAESFTEGTEGNFVTISYELIECLEADPNLLNRVITEGESRIFKYQKVKIEVAHKYLFSSQKAHMSKSKGKSTLTVFFDEQGVVTRSLCLLGKQ